mgnify:CR=1 FL=1
MQQYIPWLFAAAAVATLMAIALAWRTLVTRRTANEPPPLPTHWDLVPRPVFTADERRVYRQLREALPHHVILAKLPLVRLCQPNDPKAVRYWYTLLGSINVSYAVCSANGRVLAAVDLSYENGVPPSRSTRIKMAVLNACRVRYLRCPADHLPSIPELQLLVPHGTGASRTPQATPTMAPVSAVPLSPPPPPPPARNRAERATLWQESNVFMDSFFNRDRSFEPSGLGDLRPLPGLAPEASDDDLAAGANDGAPMRH